MYGYKTNCNFALKKTDLFQKQNATTTQKTNAVKMTLQQFTGIRLKPDGLF